MDRARAGEYEAEEASGRLVPGQRHFERSKPGKLLSPAKRGRAIEHVRDVMGISERRACRAIGQPRSIQRHKRKIPDDGERLTSQIVRLATEYGRYGYRRITALLRNDGWRVDHKRVERIWRREGLKVPQKQPKRGRLWLNDGSCIRLCCPRVSEILDRPSNELCWSGE